MRSVEIDHRSKRNRRGWPKFYVEVTPADILRQWDLPAGEAGRHIVQIPSVFS